MKNKKIIAKGFFATLLLTATLLTSCGEEHNFYPNAKPVSDQDAKVKFTNAAIGPNGTNFTANWFANDVKATAVTVTAVNGLPLGVPYGSQFPATINYALVANGNQSIKVEIPATATVAASTLLTFPLNLEAQSNYSTFIVGSSPNYASYTVKDDLSIANTDPSKAYIRFLNLIPNSPVDGYDLSIKELNSNAVIYSKVKYLQGKETYIPLNVVPDLENTSYEIQLRTVGTATIVAKFSYTPRKGRVYTIFCRGYVGGLNNGLPSATVNIPALTFYTNK